MPVKTKKTKVQSKPKKVVEAKSAMKPAGVQTKARAVEPVRVVNRISPPRVGNNGDERKAKGPRVPQFAYMKAPGIAHDFQVGDTVEGYCDQQKNKESGGRGMRG